MHHFHFMYIYNGSTCENVLCHRIVYAYVARMGDKKSTYKVLADDVWKRQRKEEGQDKDSIQTNSTPDTG